ncbi:MAG TPA: hypothetical protein VKQ30_16965 [Ktedonobacterales bacterium]|nr:hypothetical protein [Ktedonobacterales bacterium]
MSESGPPQPIETETDESFVAEISDLRTSGWRPIAGVVFWSARPLAGKRFSLHQRIVRALSAVGAVVLMLLAITVSMYGLPNLHLFERQLPQPLALSVDTGAISFLVDMAWSPGGKWIALLGCQSAHVEPCDAVQYYVPNAVLIYDARSGRLVTRIAPDGPVLSEMHTLDPVDVPAVSPTGSLSPPPPLDGIQLVYSQVLWSPDGRRLALPFFASVVSRAGLGVVWEGIVLADSDGAQVRVLFAPNLADASPLWDFTLGKPLPFSALSASAAPQEIPPALGYRWDAHDMFLPESPLTPGVVPPAQSLAPVGNPDGGAAFSIWQPGQLLPIEVVSSADGANKLFGYVFATSFVPWSPDGDRLAERSGRHPGAPLDMSAVLVPLGQSPPHPSGYTGLEQVAQFDYLPVRDRALQQLMNLGPVVNVAENGWIVAWRPDGRVLAAYGMSAMADSTNGVHLYDCATGHDLATLEPSHGTEFLGGYTRGLLRWSPDGTRLLAYLQDSATLTIWETDSLP